MTNTEKQNILNKLQKFHNNLIAIDESVNCYKAAAEQQKSIAEKLTDEYCDELERMATAELKERENVTKLDVFKTKKELKKHNYKLNALQEKINATEEQKNINELFSKVYMRNLKNTIKNELPALLIEYLSIYEGKKLGEKTYEKVRSEFLENTGLWLYIDYDYNSKDSHKIDVSSSRKFNCDFKECIYFKNNFLNSNTVTTGDYEPSEANYKIIEENDIMNNIIKWKKERENLEKEMGALFKKIKEYNGEVYGIGNLAIKY